MMEAGFLLSPEWSEVCSVEAKFASKNHARAACCGLGHACLLGWSNGCFNGARVAGGGFLSAGLLGWSNGCSIEATAAPVLRTRAEVKGGPGYARPAKTKDHPGAARGADAA